MLWDRMGIDVCKWSMYHNDPLYGVCVMESVVYGVYVGLLFRVHGAGFAIIVRVSERGIVLFGVISSEAVDACFDLSCTVFHGFGGIVHEHGDDHSYGCDNDACEDGKSDDPSWDSGGGGCGLCDG